jgi:hypothetical protein
MKKVYHFLVPIFCGIFTYHVSANAPTTVTNITTPTTEEQQVPPTIQEPPQPPCPAQNASQTQTPPTEQSNNDNIFNQLKKECTDLSKTIEILDRQVKAEECLKQNITIAELNELINRTQEDLNTRFEQLDRSDKAEILKIIKEKEQLLLKQIKDMEILLHTQKPKSHLKKKIFIACGVIASTLLMLSLLIASYDSQHDTWTWPSFDYFFENIANLFNIQKELQPSPIQPLPVPGPGATPGEPHTPTPGTATAAAPALMPNGTPTLAPTPAATAAIPTSIPGGAPVQARGSIPATVPVPEHHETQVPTPSPVVAATAVPAPAATAPVPEHHETQVPTSSPVVAATAAATTAAPRSQLNWWQRHAPTLFGGRTIEST